MQRHQSVLSEVRDLARTLTTLCCLRKLRLLPQDLSVHSFFWKRHFKQPPKQSCLAPYAQFGRLSAQRKSFESVAHSVSQGLQHHSFAQGETRVAAERVFAYGEQSR